MEPASTLVNSQQPGEEQVYSSYVSQMDNADYSQATGTVSYARVEQTGTTTVANPWSMPLASDEDNSNSNTQGTTTIAVAQTADIRYKTFQSFSTPNATPPEASLVAISSVILGGGDFTPTSTAVSGSGSGSSNSHALAVGLGAGLGGAALAGILLGVALVFKKRRAARKSFEKRTANLAQRMAEANV